jgi:CRISPR system Cascade subunit CasE
MRLFGDSRSNAGVLFRFDAERSNLYVLSKETPDIGEHCPKGFSLVGSTDLFELTGSFVAGQMYGFNLLAMPCKKVARDGKQSQRRHLKTSEERVQWLEGKAIQNGFSLVSIQEDRTLSFSSAKANGGNLLNINGTEFSGILQIVDPDLFRKAFEGGIGPEKAYGLGLLLLKKVV